MSVLDMLILSGSNQGLIVVVVFVAVQNMPSERSSYLILDWYLIDTCTPKTDRPLYGRGGAQ